MGRWLSVDPHFKKYPDSSPFVFAANNPILFIDRNGMDVTTPTEEGRNLVLSTLKYAFGQDHGFSFDNAKLIHNGIVPKNMTSQQQLLFTYITKTILISKTIVNVNIYADKTEHKNLDGSVTETKIQKGQAGKTTYQDRQDGTDNEGNVSHIPATNEIAIPGTTMVDPVEVSTTSGLLPMPKEHSLLHEVAHSIMNTIMGEFKGNFNGVDFNKMTKHERSDWAIKFTNTLLESQKKPQETGDGQHGDPMPRNLPAIKK